MQYGQFCPIAKACELIGERWTLLIIRELLCGSTRFSELQRGLSQISPSLLTKRLNQLVDDELLIRKQSVDRKKVEYFLTPSGKELAPIIMGLGDWGHRWARSRMEEDELDIELLMLEFYRRIDLEQIPGGQLVAHFQFPGLSTYPFWWIVVDSPEERELCVVNPGREADVTIRSDPRTFCEIWTGDMSFRDAKRKKLITLEGQTVMVRSVSRWLKPGLLATGKLVDQI